MVKVDWQRNLPPYFYLPQRQFHRTLLHQLSPVVMTLGPLTIEVAWERNITFQVSGIHVTIYITSSGPFLREEGEAVFPVPSKERMDQKRKLVPTSQPRPGSNLRAVPTVLCVYIDSSTSKLCLKFLNLLVLPEPELQEPEVFSVKKHLATALNVLKARILLVPKYLFPWSSLCVLGCLAGQEAGRRAPKETSLCILSPL